MMGPGEACAGGATGEWPRLAGGPAIQDGAKEQGGFVWQPGQPVRTLVLERPGQALEQPAWGAPHAAAGCDAWGERPQRGTRRPGGGRWSRWGSRRACWRAASGGGVVGPAGEPAARERASVSGGRGKRTRQAAWRKAETRGPVASARPTATGWLLNRVRRVGPHAAMASGVCTRGTPCRLAVPAAWRQRAGGASAQSRPRKAAQVSWDGCVRRPRPAGVSVARPGTGALPCGAGMRGSRGRGSPCGGVDERPRPRGGEARCVSLACYGWPIRPPWRHVPAFPASDLPGVDSITESRTVYL